MKRIRAFLVITAVLCSGFVWASDFSDFGKWADTAKKTISEYTGKLSTSKKVSITNEEAVAALKDALKEGALSAGKKLSASDGYFADATVKILMPSEAKPMLDTVGKIPQGQKLIDDVVLRLNRAAEEAAKEVVPIFVNAITSMTIADGIAIVKGGDTSATDYLKSKTRQPLMDVYRPKVDAALSKPLVMKISAKQSWSTLTTAYNKVGKVANEAASAIGKKKPMPPVEVDLATYATGKALDGLFLKIGEEEKKIRAHPLEYASNMIKKVFGALKDGLL